MQEKEEYKSYCFPSLPEKRILGNLDNEFIEKRRVELEGFLRVLVSIDKRIKHDGNISAFLTFDEEKYKDFKVDPHPYVDKMWNLYSKLPAVSVREIASQGVTQTVKQAFTRITHEMKDIVEPQSLQEDAGFIDFDQVQKVLDKNLTLLTEAQQEHETHQKQHDDYYTKMSSISDLMLDI